MCLMNFIRSSLKVKKIIKSRDKILPLIIAQNILKKKYINLGITKSIILSTSAYYGSGML